MYEWDEIKRQCNVRRHGIDFLDVLRCFSDPQRLIEEDARRNYGERRCHLLCPLRGPLYHVMFTERDQDIRIISTRRANKREQRHYERRTHHQGDYHHRRQGADRAAGRHLSTSGESDRLGAVGCDDRRGGGTASFRGYGRIGH